MEFNLQPHAKWTKDRPKEIKTFVCQPYKNLKIGIHEFHSAYYIHLLHYSRTDLRIQRPREYLYRYFFAVITIRHGNVYSLCYLIYHV